ncbi:hypothetical protein C484_10626 [Natrialba taiwanensis DSM 12281]|uniref:Uncharacterized protein n=2 Tax=Natrialba taiwanensis TaxID=160846 RepID=L9ZZH9_9EURY|nr:hypothetical protein C484_10626 [Natrialba taiwanensis DSM 12281]
MDEAFGVEPDEQADNAPPDPSKLDPLTKDEAEYERDPDGNLKPNAHAVQYNGEWRRVTVRPLLPTDQVELENKFKGREDVDFEEINPILENHIEEPAGVDWEFAKPDVFMPCLMALMEEFTGGADNEFYEGVEEELEKRDGGEGN